MCETSDTSQRIDDILYTADLSVKIPLLGAFPFSREVGHTSWETALRINYPVILRDFKRASGKLVLSKGMFGESPLTISISKKSSFRICDGPNNKVIISRPLHYVTFTQHVHTTIDKVTNPTFWNHPDIPHAEKERCLLEMLCEEFEVHIKHILFLAVLSRTHCFLPKPGSILANGNVFSEFNIDFGNWSSITESVEKHAWPKLRQIPFMKTWNWAQGIEGFCRGIGHGPAGRALAALSYATRHGFSDNSPQGLFWAALGLDAIFDSGGVSKTSQISRKTEVLFGKPPRSKKLPGQAYDLRSRILHGDVDMTFSYTETYNYDLPGYTDKYPNATYLATALLVASLQEMVIRNVYSLDFKLTI